MMALNVVAEIAVAGPADLDLDLDPDQLTAAAILALEAQQHRVAAMVCSAVRQGCTLRTLRGMEDLKAAVHLRQCSGTDRARMRLTIAVEMC